MPVRPPAAGSDRGRGRQAVPARGAGAAGDDGHVEQIAGNLEKMPPKSTYFYPKLLSGLVFHSLK